MKEVEAVTMGIYAGSRRRKGERFVVNDDESASWYVDVPALISSGDDAPLGERFAKKPDALKKAELIELGQSVNAEVDESQNKVELIEVISATLESGNAE